MACFAGGQPWQDSFGPDPRESGEGGEGDQEEQGPRSEEVQVCAVLLLRLVTHSQAAFCMHVRMVCSVPGAGAPAHLHYVLARYSFWRAMVGVVQALGGSLPFLLGGFLPGYYPPFVFGGHVKLRGAGAHCVHVMLSTLAQLQIGQCRMGMNLMRLKEWWRQCDMVRAAQTA